MIGSPLERREEPAARFPGPLSALLLHALLAVALTWPLAAHLTDRMPAGGNDLWQTYSNFWWWRTALLERQESPYETDLTGPNDATSSPPANTLNCAYSPVFEVKATLALKPVTVVGARMRYTMTTARPHQGLSGRTPCDVYENPVSSSATPPVMDRNAHSSWWYTSETAAANSQSSS